MKKDKQKRNDGNVGTFKAHSANLGEMKLMFRLFRQIVNSRQETNDYVRQEY